MSKYKSNSDNILDKNAFHPPRLSVCIEQTACSHSPTNVNIHVNTSV